MNAGFLSSIAYRGDVETAIVVKKAAPKKSCPSKKIPRKYHLKLLEVPMDSAEKMECMLINGRATEKPTIHAVALLPVVYSNLRRPGTRPRMDPRINVRIVDYRCREEGVSGLHAGLGTDNRRRDPP